MADQPEKSEAEIANEIGEASGMGAPDLSEEETPTDTEEVPADKTEEEVTPPKKPASDDTEEESEEDDTEEEDEGDEEDEAEEEADDKAPKSRVKTNKRPERLVPYSLVKDLRKDLDALTETIGKLKTDKEGKTEDEIDEIDKEAEALAQELGDIDGTYGPKDIAKILRKAVELARKKTGGEIPDDLKERLKILDKVEEQHQTDAEAAYFDKEWGSVLPALKKEYPNAGEAEIAEAKKLLDKYAHTKEYHKYDLDYIIFKKRKDFDTILKVAAKSKSGETGKRVGAEENFDATGEDDDNLENIEDLTPEIVKRREDKEAAGRESSPKDYKIQNPQR